METQLSLRYQLPTLPFVARRGRSVNGLVSDQELIDQVFDSLDTETSGRTLLHDHGLALDEPHHQPRTFEGRRRSLTITLCGDRRGPNPMHVIAVGGRSLEAKAALEEAVRRVGSIAIVHETLSQSVEEEVDFDEIADRLGAMVTEVSAVGERVRVRRDGSQFRPLPLRALSKPLEAAGFGVSVRPCWGWTPLPNVMLVALRR